MSDPYRIAVVGLGKIGLPLAVQFASKGHQVIGCDVNEETIALVNRAVSPFPGESGLDDRLQRAIDDGLLSATSDTPTAVSNSDVVVIVVSLFVDKDGVPDFGSMDAATRSIAKGLHPGMLVSYETTLPVGTTRNRFAPLLQEVSGLRPGDDFDLVFSPERVYSGRIFADLRQYPKLVGGINEQSAARGVDFYSSVLDFDARDDLARPNGVWNLGSSEASELAKLAETTFRDVNIGLANQFAKYADRIGVDVHQVIDACNSQPFSHIHRPGVAVGGHCIPIYPQMYLWNDPDATVVSAAREANSSMPTYAVDLLEQELGALAGLTIGLLGLAYRGGVKEAAFSGAFPLRDELLERGASVVLNDPMYTDEELKSCGFEPWSLNEKVDGAVLHTDHVEYRTLDVASIPGLRVIIDGRNVLRAPSSNGPVVRRIGKG